jgi:hypothetical protein
LINSCEFQEAVTVAQLFQKLLDLLPPEIALIAVFFVRRTVSGWLAAMAGAQQGRFAVGPFLRRLAAEGTYAEGVIGVWPTVTYPSHTTLVTGVSPAEHGIYANLEFDPEHHFAESWFWCAAQIRVSTLWQAAHRAGKVTASIGWPATVGADSIDYLLPTPRWIPTVKSRGSIPGRRSFGAREE